VAAEDAEALLRLGAGQLGLSLAPAQRCALLTYLAELDRWNAPARLTAYRTERARVLHLILESLLLLPVLPQDPSPLLDIGSGAGVPGLILKIARPEWRITLLEANRRRANFLRHLIRTLGLSGVSLVQGRAELLAGEPGLRARFQAVTLRAVARLDRAVALARPFVAPAGRIVIPLPKQGPRGPLVGVVREVALTPALPLRRRFLILG